MEFGSEAESKYRVVYQYTARREDELSIKVGDLLQQVEVRERGSERMTLRELVRQKEYKWGMYKGGTTMEALFSVSSGDPILYQKMDEASTIIKRDIVFAASLYTQ